MHDVELEQLSAVNDMVQVGLCERDYHLMVAGLPVRVAAAVDDVCLEVLILRDHSLHELRRAEPDERVRRLHLVDRVEQAHSGDHIDRDGQLLDLSLALWKGHLACDGLASRCVDLYKLDDLAHQDDEVKLALELSCCAVHIEALCRLLSSLDEVLNDLGLDLQFMLQSGPEERYWQESSVA